MMQSMKIDCISRQAVIDSLYDWSNHSMTDAETWHLRQVIGDIKSMPSVTPQEPREITLEDVKGYCKPRCLTIITNELLYELTHPKIKALEQEPTDKNFTKADIDAIVKAINSGWELRVNEILDKIRAEIRSYSIYVMPQHGRTIREADVLHIIDKYKAESEAEDGNDD